MNENIRLKKIPKYKKYLLVFFSYKLFLKKITTKDLRSNHFYPIINCYGNIILSLIIINQFYLTRNHKIIACDVIRSCIQVYNYSI